MSLRLVELLLFSRHCASHTKVGSMRISKSGIIKNQPELKAKAVAAAGNRERLISST